MNWYLILTGVDQMDLWRLRPELSQNDKVILGVLYSSWMISKQAIGLKMLGNFISGFWPS